MRASTIGTIFALLVGVVGMSVPPSYAVTNFSANVFGVSKTPDAECPASGQCIIRLSGASGEATSYNDFTIAGANNNPAQIVASDDNADGFRLENAVITGPAGASPCSNSNTGSPPPITNCPTIYFSALFSSPPNNAESSVTFTRSISGTLIRGTTPATNSAIRIEAWAQNNAVGSAGFKKVTCLSPASCGTLDPPQINDQTQLWQRNNGLGDPREHLVQLWFYSKFAGDKLTINFLKLDSAAGAGGGKPSCVVNAPKPKDRCKKD